MQHLVHSPPVHPLRQTDDMPRLHNPGVLSAGHTHVSACLEEDDVGVAIRGQPWRFLHTGLTTGDECLECRSCAAPSAPFTGDDDLSARHHLHLCLTLSAPKEEASSTPSPIRSSARAMIHLHRRHRKARARRASSALSRTWPITGLRSRRLLARQGCWLARQAC